MPFLELSNSVDASGQETNSTQPVSQHLTPFILRHIEVQTKYRVLHARVNQAWQRVEWHLQKTIGAMEATEDTKAISPTLDTGDNSCTVSVSQMSTKQYVATEMRRMERECHSLFPSVGYQSKARFHEITNRRSTRQPIVQFITSEWLQSSEAELASMCPVTTGVPL